MTLALALPARTQISIAIGSAIGYYRPLGTFDPESVYLTDPPRTPRDLSGLAWGGTAQAWFGKRFGAELQASIVRSTIPEPLTPEGPSASMEAQVEMVPLRGPSPLPVSRLAIIAG